MNSVARLSLSALLCAGYWQLQAQTPPSNPPERPVPVERVRPDDEKELIVLSPFEVATGVDKGYQATETLAGTRIRTDLKDVGSAISVFTSEFLRDVGATDNTTLLQYTPNAEVGGTHSTYAGMGNGTNLDESVSLGQPASNTRVRGLTAADNTRDFFATDIPWDSFDVDRIDIQRGPNAILFGLGSPAGIVNASIRPATFRNAGEVQVRVGGWDSRRATLGLNQQIIPKVLAVRIDGLLDRKRYRQAPAFENDDRLHAALRFDPRLFKSKSLHTSFRANYERGNIDANRPRTVTPIDQLSTFYGPGINRQFFTPFQVENQSFVAGDNRGQHQPNDSDFNPWIGYSYLGQQQPGGYYDANGQFYGYYGGIVNVGGRSSTGTVDNSIGIPYSSLVALASYSQYATNARLPNYQFGQYRDQYLTDPSIFNYHTKLIDGPTKREWADWDAVNLGFSQTAFDDRIGFDFAYDRQTYERGQKSLLGWQPRIYVDIMSQFQDFQANPNVGRPFTTGTGTGNTYESKRESSRAMLFGELRSEDFLDKGWLTKLLGRHRFNGVYSRERYWSENRTWNMYATDDAWARLTSTAGLNTKFSDLNPLAVVYLGPSIAGRDSSAGANIGRINSEIILNSAPVYYFSPIWNASSSVAFNAPWDVTGDPVWGAVSTGTSTQSENPANYLGWNRDQTVNILQYDAGDRSLTTAASQGLRVTDSWALSWQSFWWDGALVGTLGWRHDTVKSKNVQAYPVPTNRQRLNLSPEIYRLADKYDPNEYKDSTLSWGGVLHLNKLFSSRLPIDVGLSYNRSENFQISGTRVDLYGSPLQPPTGKTTDIGVRLSTKDNKYAFRVTKYKTTVQNGNSSAMTSNAMWWLGNVMARGLSWANVFEYNLSGYTLATADNPSYTWRYNYGPAAGETQEQATAREQAAVAAWREMKDTIDPRLYSTWGMDPSQMYQYTVVAPSGLSLTENSLSKGYEFEFMANPLPNWRISANASQTKAYRTNVGGPTLASYIALIDNYMNNTPAGDLREYSGGATATTLRQEWNANVSGNYMLKRLQEGSAVPELRKWRVNFVTNYTFDRGMLKNFGVGGGYRWEDKVVIGYPVITGSNGQATFDMRKPYYGPSEDAVDLWFSYRFRIARKVDWSIQLNVRNLFADDGVIPVSVQPDGRTWAGVRVKPDREWYLTNTFTF